VDGVPTVNAEALPLAATAYRLLDTDARSLESSAEVLAAALRARDGHMLAAVPFLAFQNCGAAGADGKPGTADDGRDLLADFPTAARPELLAQAEKALLDDLVGKPTDNSLIDRFVDYGSALALAGRSDEALGVALGAYAWARDWDRVNAAIMAVASALRSRDHHLLLANRFLAFQRYGPAGEDGKPGTADDLENPLKGLTPAIPEPLAQCVRAEAEKRIAGKDFRTAGFLLLAGARVPDALAAFRQARTRTVFDGRALLEHAYDVLAVLKARDGHVFGADAYLDFQRYGPAGKDGKTGTPDDLRDPLAGP
jgi:hypothetical protein